MQNAKIVAAPGFRPGIRTRTAPAPRSERIASSGRRTAWTRFVTLMLRGRGPSDAGASTGEASERPHRDLGLPFC